MPFNPFTTGVKNECWLRDEAIFYSAYNLPNVICLGPEKIESYLIQTFSEKVKNDRRKVRVVRGLAVSLDGSAAGANLTFSYLSIYFYNNC